jgi:hypothetical protein
MDSMFVSQDRMSREVPSPIDMLTFSTRTKMVFIFQSTTLRHKVTFADLLQVTLIYPNLLSWVMSSATRKPIQTHFVFGRLNLVTLPTVHK